MFDIEIIPYKEDTKLPENGTYFLVASNGTFLHKETALFSGFIPVQGISFLEEFCSQDIKYFAPKIPASLVSQTLTFFRKVWETCQSEAIVLLYYNKEKGYFISAPPQIVSRTSISYNAERFNGYLLVGTIHSHCNFSAFHSPVDEFDEAYFDGLHCTFGNVDKENISIVASLVLNKIRKDMNPSEVMEINTNNSPDNNIIAEWMEKVSEKN